jgi:hypothetical protein
MITHEGQTICFVGKYRGDKPVLVTVVKMGRKWALLSNHYRVDIKTNEVDNEYGNAPNVYESIEAFHAQNTKKLAINSFVHDVSKYGSLHGVTVEQIEEARKILGLSK